MCLHIFDAVKGVVAGRARARRVEPTLPPPVGQSLPGELGRPGGQGPAGQGLRGSHPCMQIPQGAREDKYDGHRLLSVLPSEINRAHRQEITVISRL